MSVLFTLVHPPTLLSVIFTLAGVCTFHTEQIHIHSYFTLRGKVTLGEVIVYEVTIYEVILIHIHPPIHFGGNKRCLWGQRNIYI